MCAVTGVGAAVGGVDFVAGLEKVLEERGVPAVGGAVFTAERVLVKAATGVRRRGEHAEVTVDDRWHLGSCTKAMTGTLAAVAVERGELEWGSTLGEVLGTRAGRMHEGYEDVTLERLMANRGGVAGRVQAGLLGELRRGGAPGRRQRIELMKVMLAVEPAEGYVYSNSGITAAGVMVEQAGKKAWERLITERVFDVLGMGSAGFGAPGNPRKLDEPWGHGGDGRAVRPGPGGDNPAAIGPAGTVHASIGDWAKFGMAHLAQDVRLLRVGSWEVLHTVRGGEAYAHGWSFSSLDGEALLAHTGSNTMWHAKIWLVPAKGWGVLAVSNDGAARGREACQDVIDIGLRMHRGE